jgi:hypothetical protein
LTVLDQSSRARGRTLSSQIVPIIRSIAGSQAHLGAIIRKSPVSAHTNTSSRLVVAIIVKWAIDCSHAALIVVVDIGAIRTNIVAMLAVNVSVDGAGTHASKRIIAGVGVGRTVSGSDADLGYKIGVKNCVAG